MYQDWMDYAACRDVDPRIFDNQGSVADRPFPKDGGRRRKLYRDNYRQARTTCGGCLVQIECLSYMLTLPEEYMVHDTFAAGLTPEELARLTRRKVQR